MRRSFIVRVGEFPPGENIVGCFESSARALGYGETTRVAYFEAGGAISLQPSETPDDRFVLFCVHRGAGDQRELLRLIRRQSTKVIIYADREESSADRALGCCVGNDSPGLADDYFVMGESQITPEMFEEHMLAIERKKCPYKPLKVRIRPHQGRPVVFFSTPFAWPQKKVMVRAAQLAVEKAGFTAWFSNDYVSDHIGRRVDKEIASSHLFLANISVRNENVSYEIGRAPKRSQVLIRAIDARGSVPAILAGRCLVEFHHEIDLALQLYHGLTELQRAQVAQFGDGVEGSSSGAWPR